MPSNRSIWRRIRDATLGQRNEASCWISYARSDKAYVNVLSHALNRRGIGVLLDTGDLQAGAEWAVSFRESLLSADVLIFVAGEEARQSQWLFEELRLALESGMPIIPLVMGSIDNLPFELADRKAVVERDPARPSPEVLDLLVEAIVNLAAERVAPRTVDEARPAPPVIHRTNVRPPAHEPPAQRKPVRDGRAPRTLDEGKLILVGRGEVGKTSLVRRLVDDEFRIDESTTQGIRITHWNLLVADRPVRLNVWDFGGQEIMHATHRFFLTEQSLYLLVLNGRGGDEDVDAEYWLRHIQGFGGDSPVIVVLNKIGQHPFELNFRGLQLRYPQIQAFVRTDCADGVGIDDLRLRIERAASEMPEVGMRFPADWFAVKERLERIDLDYMGYDEYRNVCAEAGIEAQTDLDTLSFVLHCLGIALNYRKDPRLRETSVLRPEWVTGGIYRILNAGRLADRGGELRVEDLAEILPADRYPADKHVFLIELMRKFDLCLPFRNDVDAYLVPDLLGKEESVEASSFEPAVCLNFEYRYDILAEGIIPRFIVRSRSLSGERDRWRSGVILRREECRALVTSHQADRRVRVRIRGGDADARRELLAIIRYDVDGINGEFKETLGATPAVPLPDHPGHAVEYQKLVKFERHGVVTFPEVVGRDVFEIDVAGLLNGVDVSDRSASSPTSPAPSVFLSYAHEDESLRDQLETHLKLLQRQGVISIWHDRKLLPGAPFDDDIDRSLASASIVLLLVSSDFLASDYCWGKEVATALDRQASGLTEVVPVMLRPCDWDGAPFAHLAGLPIDMEPVTTFENSDVAWTQVSKGIRTLAQSLRT